MRFKWVISAAALFLVCVFLGMWVLTDLLGAGKNSLITDGISEISENAGEASENFSEAVNAESGDSVSTESSQQPGSSQGEMSAPSADDTPQNDLLAKAGFEVSSTSVYPGEFIVIYAYGIENAADISVQSPFSRAPQFFESGDHLTALLPVKYVYEPGEYLITCTGGGYSEEFLIDVISKQWQTQNLVVDESITSETVDNDNANAEYSQKVQPKKYLSEPAPLWEGAFLQPVSGEITTEFGMVRTVNSVPSDRHGGVDIAAARGTEVKATNSGKVLFAEFIALTGNTVCIEHGLGLKSWYYHMDSLNVSEGDIVKKGDVIGTVGTTGFSTGPHLHWAVSVFDVYVNPWPLIEQPPEI